VPHAQPISFFAILLPAQYWVRSTNHLAPRYAISSIPPLPRLASGQIFSSTPCSQTPSASFTHAHYPAVIQACQIQTSLLAKSETQLDIWSSNMQRHIPQASFNLFTSSKHKNIKASN